MPDVDKATLESVRRLAAREEGVDMPPAGSFNDDAVPSCYWTPGSPPCSGWHDDAVCKDVESIARREKQRMLQEKLDAMMIGGQLKLDTSRMSCRRCGAEAGKPHRYDCNLSFRGWKPEPEEAPRLDNERLLLAKDLLLAMINNGGDKHDKVRAAVEYADLLIAELEGK